MNKDEQKMVELALSAVLVYEAGKKEGIKEGLRRAAEVVKNWEGPEHHHGAMVTEILKQND